MVDTTVKDKVIRAVEEMPPDVSFEDLMERIYLLYKIDRGLKQVEAGPGRPRPTGAGIGNIGNGGLDIGNGF